MCKPWGAGAHLRGGGRGRHHSILQASDWPERERSEGEACRRVHPHPPLSSPPLIPSPHPLITYPHPPLLLVTPPPLRPSDLRPCHPSKLPHPSDPSLFTSSHLPYSHLPLSPLLLPPPLLPSFPPSSDPLAHRTVTAVSVDLTVHLAEGEREGGGWIRD